MLGSHLVGLTVRLPPGTGATLSAGVGTETAVTARTGTTVSTGVGVKKALVGRRGARERDEGCHVSSLLERPVHTKVYASQGGEKESQGFCVAKPNYSLADTQRGGALSVSHGREPGAPWGGP